MTTTNQMEGEDYWDDYGTEEVLFKDEDLFDLQLNPASLLKDTAKESGKKLVKKVRHRIKRLQRDIPTVKLRDKLSFFFGVWSIIILVFILGNKPEYFARAYGIIFLTLIPIRWYLYRRLKWHYFLFDFCYFANFLLLVYLFFVPRLEYIFHICFACAAGPLPVAILAWKNSLVFHSMDKLTSLFIHIAPATQVFLVRWMLSGQYLGCDAEECEAPLENLILYPVLFYVFWQILYFVKVELLSAEKVASRGYLTSANWMIQDEKGMVAKLMPKNWTSRSAKVFFFMFLQFAFTFVTILPSWFAWHYQTFHLVYLLFFIGVSIWNGGSFYIEVFSVRYVQNIEKLKKELEDLTETDDSESDSMGT